ncbi:MAG: hypothetical protein WBL93_13910 [Lutisporaceae bacterium]
MLKPEIPITIGYKVEKALELLKEYKVIIEDTSTVFNDKIQERKDNIPVVVRQIFKDNFVFLTVAKFK